MLLIFEECNFSHKTQEELLILQRINFQKFIIFSSINIIELSDDFIRIIIVLMFHPGNCALKRKVHLPNGIVAQKLLPTRESYLELPLFNDIGAFF